MSDDAKVINLADARPRQAGYDGLVCECGSAWWHAKVAIDRGGSVGSRAVGITCVECGTEVNR